MADPVTLGDFRAVFDEFSAIPDLKISFWLDDANQSLSQRIFGDSWKTAVMLYVAHNLSMSKQQASSGGMASGIVSSKSVGPVSKSYDTGSTSIANAGTWNYTSYGQRLAQMWRGACAVLYIPGDDRFR